MLRLCLYITLKTLAYSLKKKEISGFLFAFFFGPLHNACIYNFYFESQWARMEKRETTQGKEEMEKLCVQKRIWDEMKTEKLRKR